ncbi:hypothetical protein FC685_29390 [Bacillus cereus]|uniref:hypothetical protein n=1 Tax=Bacillus cereus TaxID=1396 RepID=UPI0010BF110D|nr:hypothetical protein [Bacillus cereus]TKH82435.1 hypothetical protein FC685_29390 [Bacillus cereus]
MSGKRKDVKLHVTTTGELNCKLFAEKFVEIVRKEILNGEIDLEKYKEIIKAENLRDKKE